MGGAHTEHQQAHDGDPVPGRPRRHRRDYSAFPEIIEIGNAILHVGDLSVEPGPEILVRPMRSTASRFCTELTGITQEMIDEGSLPFADAIKMLREAHGEIRRMVWASYGEYDRKKLTEECRHHDVPFPLCDTHLNVKRLVALVAG